MDIKYLEYFYACLPQVSLLVRNRKLCYFLKLNWEQKDAQLCLAVPFGALCLCNNGELATENSSYNKGRGELPHL